MSWSDGQRTFTTTHRSTTHSHRTVSRAARGVRIQPVLIEGRGMRAWGEVRASNKNLHYHSPRTLTRTPVAQRRRRLSYKEQIAGSSPAGSTAGWTGAVPARSHKPFDAGSSPAPAIWR